MEPDDRDGRALLTVLTTEHFTLQDPASERSLRAWGERPSIWAPWRPFFGIANVIAIINSMVAGALAGITLDVFVPRTVAVLAGVVLAAGALTIHFRLGNGRFVRAMANITPRFSSTPQD